MTSAYRIATTLIIAGFIMLCQPFLHQLFVWGFPVLLCGAVLFLILDHIPAPNSTKEEGRG